MSNQSQKSGDNSTNIQATNFIINSGVTVENVREIFLEMFRENFLKMSSVAYGLAEKRLKEFTEEFIRKLIENKPEAIEGIQDPAFLFALYEAQKNVAKTGDKDMGEVLIDVLVDQIGRKNRDLRQIVLEESISVIPKLTISQLDILTIVFVLCNSKHSAVNSLQALKEHLVNDIMPFCNNLTDNQAEYQHLQFTGCANVQMGSYNVYGILKSHYGGLFCKGFTREFFEKMVGDFKKYGSLTTVCLHDKELLQVDAISRIILLRQLKTAAFEQAVVDKYLDLYKKNLFADDRVKDKIIEIAGKFMADVFSTWGGSLMGNLTLSTIGIAIAHANYRRKTGKTLDLKIWIP